MRKTEKPCAKGCTHSGGWFKRHSWKYSGYWNGNNRRVLPFSNTTRGIARPGWRCYWCGEFRWDQSNIEYALSVAHAWGLIKIPLGEHNANREAAKEECSGALAYERPG